VIQFKSSLSHLIEAFKETSRKQNCTQKQDEQIVIMKRALAQRAKESLPQQDPPTNAHDASNNGSSNGNGNDNSSQNGGLSNGMSGMHQHQHQHTIATNSSLKLKRPNSHSNTSTSNNSGSSFSLEQPNGQPPLKIPRTERVGMGLAPSSSSASLLQVSSSLSPRAPKSSKKMNLDQSSALKSSANANPNTTTALTTAASSDATTTTASDAATEPTASKQQLSTSGAAATGSASAATTTTITTAAPDNDGEDDEETESDRNSAFYLKHQNRALATELKGLQHSVQWLERERDYRRQQCLLSVQALNSLQATWTQLEDVLSHSHHHHQGLQQNLQQQLQQRQIQQHNYSASDKDLQQERDGPASTGTGGSVEWTLALSKALAELGSSNSLAAASFTTQDSMAMDIQGRQDNEDDDDNDEDDDDDNLKSNHHQVDQGEGVDTNEKATLEDLSQISANVSARAAVLQEWILETVLKQLEQQQQSQQQQPDDLAVPSASDAPPVLLADQKKIAELAAKCELLQHQVTELKAARDATASRERRVRRNLYRLSAGMMTVQQVLQTLEDAEGDDVNGRQGDQEERIIKQQAAEQAATVAKLQEQLEDSRHAAQVKQQGNEATTSVTTVSSAEVQSLKEKVASLEHICQNRETSVQEVRKHIPVEQVTVE
jgi:hypothetical protein